MKIVINTVRSIHELGARQNQEDSIFPPDAADGDTDNRLFVLCDGMGGHESGEVASATVCEALSEYACRNFPPDGVVDEAAFVRALSAAYDALDANDHGDTQRKMGTTLTCLVFHRGGCLAAHVGDSRIYHIRPSQHAILYRSRDHSLVQSLYDVSEISLEEMKTSPDKNVITRAMQPHKKRDKADIKQIADIREGDYFYLCSDGMLEQMDDEQLLDIVCNDELTDDRKREALVEATADNKDNHSAFLIRVGEVTPEEEDAAWAQQLDSDKPVTPTVHGRFEFSKSLKIGLAVALLLALLACLWWVFSPKPKSQPQRLRYVPIRHTVMHRSMASCVQLNFNR